MFRVIVVLTALMTWSAERAARAQSTAPAWYMVYTRSHRATFHQEWKYTFPDHKSRRWIIALRYPPGLPWSRDALGTAELHTSSGWKAFKEVIDESRERRRMLVIDHAHSDPLLRKGFTVRTTLTATIYDQRLERGRVERPIFPLAAHEREQWLASTHTYDFHAPLVKNWMDHHKMWKGENEDIMEFVHRVYKQLRVHMPYSTKDGGEWICSQILKAGFGECCRHSIVATAILRANRIPARTVCGLWVIDNKSQGAHCWGEFYLHGAGWVPYDTTLGDDKKSDVYFGNKKGKILGGMVDFDWLIDAGPFCTQRVSGIDAFPAFWSQGEGKMDNQKCDTHTSMRILKNVRRGTPDLASATGPPSGA